MPYLSWISDNDLIKSTEYLLRKAVSAKKNAPNKLYGNVVDPISAMFQISGFDITHDEFQISEISRQAQKSYQNHVGVFHQKILGSVNGWKDLGTGNIIDLVSDEKKIIAEVKNKHNTVTGVKLCDNYDVLESAVMPNLSKYKGYTSYFVTIIPAKPVRINAPFTPSDNKTKTRRPVNENIRIIDGASFYQIVSGESDALKDLFEKLPEVINRILGRPKLGEDDKRYLNDLFNKAF